MGSQGEEESGVRCEGAGETSHALLESTLLLFSSLRHYLSAVTPRSLIAFFMQMKFTINNDIRTDACYRVLDNVLSVLSV